MKSPGATWGAPEISSWRELPHIVERLATESDVQQGRAVFVTVRKDGSPSSARPHPLPIPRCAILHAEPPGPSQLPVFVIQAEEVDGKLLVGYRPITGGNGICTLAELELLSGPDERFGPNAGGRAGV
jgi:hypothetical protein